MIKLDFIDIQQSSVYQMITNQRNQQLSFKRRIKLFLLSVAKLLGVFRACKWLTRNKLQILCYHGFELIDEASFRPALFIREKTFKQRLQLIKKHGFSVIGLDEAVRQLQSSQNPPNSIVITVDDGFYSFYKTAVPLLRQFGFPVTLYLTSYYVEKNTPVFRLMVQYIFYKSTLNHDVLMNCEWMGDYQKGADELSRDDVMWLCIDHGEKSDGESFRRALLLDLAERMRVDIRDMGASRGLSLVNAEEIIDLITHQVQIQLHTHRHRSHVENPSLLCAEIQDNRDAFQRLRLPYAEHFCYPSGEWSSLQLEVLSAAGIKSATTCDPGMNSKSSSLLLLTRFLDGEHIEDLEFEATLCGVFELISWIPGLSAKKQYST